MKNGIAMCPFQPSVPITDATFPRCTATFIRSFIRMWSNVLLWVPTCSDSGGFNAGLWNVVSQCGGGVFVSVLASLIMGQDHCHYRNL